MTVRFGIIGTGYACDNFAAALRQATGAKLHAVLSRKRSSAEAFASKHATSRQQCYDDLKTFLGDRYMDAVYIGVPPGLHALYADAAAASGKHVFVEKPLATSKQDAVRIREACAQAGVKLGVGYQNRFHPLHEKIRDWVRAGHIGDVVLARARWFRWSGTDPKQWRWSRELAGWWALGDLGTHCLDLLEFFLGDIVSVTASVRPPSDPSQETEDTAILFLKHESGLPSIMECSTVSPAPGTLIEIYGSRGYIRAEDTIGMDGEGTLVKAELGGKEVEFTDWSRPAELFVSEVADFLDSIRDEREPQSGGKAGQKGVELLEATMRATQEGHTILL